MSPFSIPPIVMADIVCYVGLYHLMIYLRRRQYRENLTFALMCFVVCLYDVCSAGLDGADSAGLTQALRNLINDAIKFTRDVPAPRIELGGRETENACILWVRDNGIGFDMQYRDRIFDIFQRLHRSEDYPGTGIGLALVRKAAQRMGGRVSVESVPGAGAIFYLEIPK